MCEGSGREAHVFFGKKKKNSQESEGIIRMRENRDRVLQL